MKIAVVGATGLVGSVMLKVLEESEVFRRWELIPVASEKSVGTKLLFMGREHTVVSAQDAIDLCPQIALFSAGAAASGFLAPRFAEAGCTVIDNSSHWRMFPEIPLVVPEINAHVLSRADKIIANPNCSTIQLVMALAPLHKAYGIARVVVSTYQSVTGTGIKAVQQLENELNNQNGPMAYPHPILMNLFPHGGAFLDNGYTTEEMKLVHETRKIIGDENIQLTATVVRVPVLGGHSEAVNVEFEQDYDLGELITLLDNTQGIVVQDDGANNIYPMPLFAEGKNDVFVGRIRRDESREKCVNMWIVSDNLRKGAATNAVQIAEYLVENQLA
jgi:aspartate-semialdehyde dehydrogenase